VKIGKVKNEEKKEKYDDFFIWTKRKNNEKREMSKKVINISNWFDKNKKRH